MLRNSITFQADSSEGRMRKNKRRKKGERKKKERRSKEEAKKKDTMVISLALPETARDGLVMDRKDR
jgi:hypothetical protein